MLETLDHLFGDVAFHRVREGTLQKHKRLQRLAQVVTRRSQKTRLRGIRPIGNLFCFPQRGLYQLAFCNVRKRNDNAPHSVVLRPVRQDSTNKPDTGLRLYLTLGGDRRAQYRACVGKKIVIRSQRFEISQRPAYVARQDTKQRSRRRGEKADIELHVQEERRYFSAVQDVLEIVGRRSLPLQRLL